MRVLVCGGRTYADVGAVSAALDGLGSLTCIIQGGASGADHLAAHYGRLWSVPVETFPADWTAHGRAAGPIRNERMLREGRPDIVLAFPGGRGTANMVSLAKAAGVRVLEFA